MSACAMEWSQLHPEYSAVLGRLEVLGPDEERALAQRARAGDRAARDRLVEGSLRYVVRAVRRYRRPGIDLMDLVAEGNAGLLEAIRRFDPDRGIRFVCYAVWWIRDAVGRFLASQAGVVPVPRKALARLRSRRLPKNPQEWADRQLLLGARGAGIPFDRLETEPATGGPPPRGPSREDPAARVLEILDRERRHLQLCEALARLPPGERQVIDLHHGLGRREPMDFRSLARRQGVSRETSRCTYHRALARLRKVLSPPEG